jgi:TPR repeat protein
MSFIEVFDPNERSFYRAELLEIKGDFASIVFEGAEKATNVATRFIRPEPDPVHCGYTPQLHDGVEVRFCMLHQAPSYWEGTVRNIIGGVALVAFPDPNYNDVYEFSLLRPASGLMVGHESVFELFTVPRDFLHNDFVELNKAAIDCIRKTSDLTSLRFMPTHQALALHGCNRSVSEAKSLLSTAFAAAAAAAAPDIPASSCSAGPIAPSAFVFRKGPMYKTFAQCLLSDLVDEISAAAAITASSLHLDVCTVRRLLSTFRNTKLTEAVLQLHPLVRGDRGLVCTATAESKQAWCNMLHNLFNAANVDVSADVVYCVYSVCRECARIGQVQMFTHPIFQRLQTHPALPLVDHVFAAEALAHPVFCLASRMIVQRWEVMFHCRAPSQASAQQWRVFGIKISQKQMFALLARSALLQALVQRLLCFQGKYRVRYPLHCARFIMSQSHFVGSKMFFQEGQRLYGQQRYSEAAKSWGQAALLQHAPSHAFLSNMLIEGRHGVPKNEKLAFELASVGARLHCAHSKGVLGRCLVYGIGVEKNDAIEGLALGRESEAAGSCFGQFAVGKCYEQGWGVAKNVAKAVCLWKLAAAQGHMTAQYNLGIMFATEFGIDVEYDPIEAVRLFNLAAAQGHVNARNNLDAMFFFSGIRAARQ